MDRANAIFIADHASESLSTVAAEPQERAESPPFAPMLAAMQKRAADRRLDPGLADLVRHRAVEFATLSPREQAAIAWVEAVISTGKTQAADGAYAALKRYFDDAAVAKLTALAGTASARAKLGVSREG